MPSCIEMCVSFMDAGYMYIHVLQLFATHFMLHENKNTGIKCDEGVFEPVWLLMRRGHYQRPGLQLVLYELV